MSFRIVSQAQAAASPSAPPNTGDAGIDLSQFLTLKSGAKVSDVFKTPADMVNLIIPNVFLLAGILLFVYVILAGYKFISGGSKGMEEAKGMFSGAIIGFIVMFSAFWIIQIVKLMTGANIIF